MSKKIKVALAGLGSRGKDTYAKAAELFPDKMEITAIADINPKKVAMVAERYHIPKERCYASAEDMLKEVRLISFEIIEQNIQVYSPVTFKHLNLFTEKMLSMPGGINGIFNIFDMDKNHIVDKEKMNDDILQYGMFDYKDFEKYMSENFYEAFNGKYLKVALGKGILSKNKLAFLIEKYCKFDN